MGSFSDQVAAWQRKTEAAILDTFREAFVEAGLRVIRLTPKDTGRARGSWQSAKNGFASGETPDRDETAAEAELRALAATLTLGDMANFSSSLFYIRTLEHGGNNIRPHAMIGLTAQHWDLIVKEAIGKARAKHGLS
jgi:hypothetical protein